MIYYLWTLIHRDPFFPASILSSPARLRRTLVVTANVASANRLISLLDRLDILLASSLGVGGRSQRLRGNLLLHGLLVTTLSKLVDTRVVDLVGPSLVDVNEEDDIVAESGETV